MDRTDYLVKLADNDVKNNTENVLNTWSSLGEVTATKITKFYSKGQVFRVRCDNGDFKSDLPLHNCILYCQQDYAVNNKEFLPIDWGTMVPDDVTGLLVSVEGISLPYFVILPGIKWNGSFSPDLSFVPFLDDDKNLVDTVVDISDSELQICLTDLGMPWLTWDEVEYSRSQIVNLCVKPAMDYYWTYFPIVKEQGFVGSYSSGLPFKIEMPENAYWAIPYYCSGLGGAGGGGNYSPFSYYNEQLIWTGGGMFGTGSSRFGKGCYYPNKQTPGFTGAVGHFSSLYDNRAIAQDVKNYMRQEKFSIVKESDGKRYVEGFSTIGGQLNIKWLCNSKNWEDIPYFHLETVARPLVKIKALRAVKAIRDLVKSDTPGTLDTSPYEDRATKMEEKIKPLIDDFANSYKLSIARSGGGQ